MKKSILTLFASLALSASVFAQYTSIVQNDPTGDAGMMGVDVKNLSYQLSADKTEITFKVETYSAVNSWDYAGFLIYVDENLDPTTGMTPECNNQSMKADRCIMLMNMMGSWSADVTAVNTQQSGNIASLVTISQADNNKTTLIKLPLAKVDSDGDGKFNMIFATAVASGSSFYVDDLPNTGYSTLAVKGTPTGINDAVPEGSQITVYPVPASNQLNLTADVALDGVLQMMDATGRSIAAQDVKGTKISIPVATYANGTYYFRLVNKSQQVLANGRFIIQH